MPVSAITEFCTWWIESGPTTSTSSPSASSFETIHFVSWSAAIAESATRPRLTHWRGSARVSPAPARDAGSAPFLFAFAIDAESRPRHRLESFSGDGCAAVDAFSVGAVLDPLQGGVDRAEQPLVVLFERVADLALDRLRGRVRQVLVSAARNELPALILQRAGVLLVEVREGSRYRLPLLDEQVAEVLDVDRAHRESLRAASDAAIPLTSTTLSREPCPATSLTSSGGIRSVSASRATAASFARPHSGGAATRTFQASPCRPTTPGLFDPGTTRSRNRVAPPATPGFEAAAASSGISSAP